MAIQLGPGGHKSQWVVDLGIGNCRAKANHARLDWDIRRSTARRGICVVEDTRK